jgi:hypothetical protein
LLSDTDDGSASREKRRGQSVTEIVAVYELLRWLAGNPVRAAIGSIGFLLGRIFFRDGLLSGLGVGLLMLTFLASAWSLRTIWMVESKAA